MPVPTAWDSRRQNGRHLVLDEDDALGDLLQQRDDGGGRAAQHAADGQHRLPYQ
jgi:hypothetical protein